MLFAVTVLLRKQDKAGIDRPRFFMDNEDSGGQTRFFNKMW